jgi:hypothetical protein
LPSAARGSETETKTRCIPYSSGSGSSVTLIFGLSRSVSPMPRIVTTIVFSSAALKR